MQRCLVLTSILEMTHEQSPHPSDQRVAATDCFQKTFRNASASLSSTSETISISSHLFSATVASISVGTFSASTFSPLVENFPWISSHSIEFVNKGATRDSRLDSNSFLSF
ncbi:uncharacterized protein LOC111290704 [Durio zibethinus]|uniref:Uncharacterized protein LOC111290704 n=1 Tax=Durio zibethinus TaxID=66656 RepID=A0A6P5YCU8_DURZI|nr:uncharacterized protein LOC111290704 [Durio zibethinus]